MKALLLSALISMLCGCVGAPAVTNAEALSPDELNRRSTELDGAGVVVRGYLVHEAEALGLWDSKAAEEKGEAAKCVSLLYPDSIRQNAIRANRKEVVVRGVFRKDVTANGGLFLGLCNYSGVIVNSVDGQG